jgi:hypothetical protein
METWDKDLVIPLEARRRWHKKPLKISDEQVSEIARAIVLGMGLRASARKWGISAPPLQARLIRQYGRSTYKKMICSNGILATYRDHLRATRNPAKKAQLEAWLFNNLKVLIDQDCDERLLTDSQIRGATYKEAFYAIDLERTVAGRRADAKRS